MYNKKAVGARIRERRVAMNKSLRQLAREAKIAPSYLSMIERGLIPGKPSDAVLDSIAYRLKAQRKDLLKKPR